MWQADGMNNQGSALALAGNASDAIEMFDYCRSDNGAKKLGAILFAALGPRACGAWAIRGGLALHRRSDDSG
jgi:hypothetical protein